MNFVITLSIHKSIAEWILRLLWQCYDEIHCQYRDRRTKHWRQFVFFFLPCITDCQIVRLAFCSRSLTHRINYKFMCLSAYWQWKLANERARIAAVIIKLVIWFRSSGFSPWHSIKNLCKPSKRKHDLPGKLHVKKKLKK